ncbi:ligand-binding protein SH3 [Williamsia sp. 1135]|nr:ligand-binding protein SH3 [Williamsia sp. 1135]
MINDDHPGRSKPYPDADKTVLPAKEYIMAWLVLVASGVFEAVWATALGRSEGFSKLTPTIVFVGGLVISMLGLAYAMRTLPTGTSYAIWVGIGAALTVSYAMITGSETASVLKIVLIFVIVGVVVGLKLSH